MSEINSSSDTQSKFFLRTNNN